MRLLALALLCLPLAALAQPTVFSCTSAPQAYVVPAGVTQLRVVAAGGAGGRVSATQTRPLGAQVQVTITVVPGETLTVVVGEQGPDGGGSPSYNGGGAGGNGAGAGGGATDLRRATATLDYLPVRHALLVAGGAGGSDWLSSPDPQGGAGGTPVGGDGICLAGNRGGLGATQQAPGAGGIAGSNAQGGAGGYGGGGGGYYGGGAALNNGGCGGGGGGSSWVDSTVAVGKPAYSLTNIASAGWLIVTPVTSPLPVQLVGFTATLLSQEVALAWFTAAEKNSAHFDIERSADGVAFTKLAPVAAHGTTSHASAYAYRDTQPLAGISYYRLRQVDLDGSVCYSPVRSVARGAIGSAEVFPNPWTTSLYVRLPAAGLADFALYDALGKCVLRYAATGVVVALPVPDVPAGLYHLHISQNGASKVVKLQH